MYIRDSYPGDGPPVEGGPVVCRANVFIASFSLPGRIIARVAVVRPITATLLSVLQRLVEMPIAIRIFLHKTRCDSLIFLKYVFNFNDIEISTGSRKISIELRISY